MEKVYFACFRYLIQEFYSLSKCLIVDTDSLFLKDFQFPKENIGVCIESEMSISRQIKAGCFYFNSQSKEFIKYNNKILLDLIWNGLPWYVDQFSLFVSYEVFKKNYDFYKFNRNFFSNNILDNPILFAPRGEAKNEKDFLKIYNDFLKLSTI